MCAIQKLLSKKDGLLIQIACIVNDLREYCSYPVETVSVNQLHYQYDLIIKEIRQIDRKLYELFNKQTLFFESQNFQLKKLTDKATSEILFTVKDLPKHHWTMFEDLNPINE
ncbi:hypothetical protein [Flavobacterium salmonis]|uniref:Uncharacterized protein n=1 Tax=Flavobacterium salmonis TaxID=2654844 RepID=A0A6V6Z4Q5_9FLAO|nr:hypothetical protein [Flavobacterium salmonis]CAD0006559.1 hypothetical protein FLAT13_03342 [Flavobacterium salmonis]